MTPAYAHTNTTARTAAPPPPPLLRQRPRPQETQPFHWLGLARGSATSQQRTQHRPAADPPPKLSTARATLYFFFSSFSSPPPDSIDLRMSESPASRMAMAETRKYLPTAVPISMLLPL